MNASRGGREGGFTLVEVLVTIGIIVVLATLLVPGLNASAARANRVACLSQMRQIGSAFLTYASENNQRGPYDGRDDGNESIALWKYKGKSVLFGFLLPYLGAENAERTPHVLICPGASKKFRADLLQSWDNTSYWINPDASSNSQSATSLLALPGDRVIIMDTCTWWKPGLFGNDYDNHAATGANVFRLNGSAAWIPITNTLGLGEWDWAQLDKK